jgi:hypothetical protein
MKPRSLPNSTLDHANQNGFHLPHDPLAGSTSGTRTPKTHSRTSYVEYMKKPPQHSLVRYNPGKFKLKYVFYSHFYFGQNRPCSYKIYSSMFLLMFIFISSFVNFAIVYKRRKKKPSKLFQIEIDE